MAARVLEAGLVISSGSTQQSMALPGKSGGHHVFEYKRNEIAAKIAMLPRVSCCRSVVTVELFMRGAPTQ
jgi:hypothetical protein